MKGWKNKKTKGVMKMKKAMVLFGIAASLLVGCSDVKTKEEAKPKQVTETKQSTKVEKNQTLELPALQFNKILLQNVDEMKQAFLQAGMTEKEGRYTYGDISIDSIKEIRDSIYFTLTFKDAVSDSTRYHAFDSLHIQRMSDDHIQKRMEEKEKDKEKKDTGRVSDNLAYVLETSDKMEKYITWTVVEDQNGNTKQVKFRVQKAQI